MESKEDNYEPKLGKCGLRNIGNTCYMNSVLQLLLHCKPLISFLMKKEETSDYIYYLEKTIQKSIATEVRKKRKLNEEDEVIIKREDIEEQKKSSITVELSKMVDIIINKGASTITPVSFKQSIDKKLSIFRGGSQQDAHEFIIYILDLIIEETGVEIEATINNIPEKLKYYQSLIKTFCELEHKEQTPEIIEHKKSIKDMIMTFRSEHKELINQYHGIKYLLSIYKKKYNPFIFQLKTLIINYIQCEECKNVMTNYEHTTLLQLYVSETLSGSFSQFVNPEKIENYNCEHCKEKRTITKTSRLWRLPSILFIQLKRFQILMNGRIVKNTTDTEIPMSIDLSSYCDDTMNTTETISKKYKLRGFSNHMGSLNGGHYTANCLCLVDNETWYEFDDSRVSRNTNKIIDTSNAYILMYELE